MASTIPEPQMPTGGVPPIVVSSTPSSRSRTASIAPLPARIPSRMWAPSNAGPEAHEADVR